MTYQDAKDIVVNAAKQSFATGWLSRLLGLRSTGAVNLRAASNLFFFHTARGIPAKVTITFFCLSRRVSFA